jgi:hypothetical protein
MKACEHPADKAQTDTLLMTCPDCGAECSGTQIGADRLCYDQHCPLHVMAGHVGDETMTTEFRAMYQDGDGDGWGLQGRYATVEDARAALSGHRALGRRTRIVRGDDMVAGDETIVEQTS